MSAATTATADRLDDLVKQADAARDEHLRAMVAWHFTPKTGTPFWLDWAKEHGVDAVKAVQTFDDLKQLPRFEDEWLRHQPHARWIPNAYAGRPFKVFETGGTTGMPKQRISWEDHLTDYSQFSERLDQFFPGKFPRGAAWMMLGPTGPRRLRLAIEHLANERGGSCYFVDLDPRFVKRAIAEGQPRIAQQYMQHVIDQAATIIRHRDVGCLFATPRLLEALGERMSLPDAGISGVFCGGTSMTPQVIRFLCEEVLENKAALAATYGNTLMGLAIAEPVTAENGYRLTYHAPEPRAILRVVDKTDEETPVDYGQWGRVELTTLTKEFFMPRFLERDEAVRCKPFPGLPWDGVGDVRPLGWETKKTVEGVY